MKQSRLCESLFCFFKVQVTVVSRNTFYHLCLMLQPPPSLEVEALLNDCDVLYVGMLPLSGRDGPEASTGVECGNQVIDRRHSNSLEQ